MEVEIEEVEIDEVLNWCNESIDENTSRYEGMSYEEGVRDALLWIREEAERPDA